MSDHASVALLAWVPCVGENPSERIAVAVSCRGSAAPFPAAMLGVIDSIVLGGILDRIESITETTISAIVNRIPHDYRAPEQRESIAQGLLARRDLVRGLVTQQQGGARETRLPASDR